jgi:DNA-directed RNA polymerase subunit RPC12/RpoP
MTYEFDWEETGEFCPQCGGAFRIRSCEICDGEGEIDLYEEDAINFSPGETEYCEACSGTGIDEWCPNCGDVSRETCPTCGGNAYVLDPDGNGVDDYLACPDCDGDRILIKLIPFHPDHVKVEVLGVDRPDQSPPDR